MLKISGLEKVDVCDSYYRSQHSQHGHSILLPNALIAWNDGRDVEVIIPDGEWYIAADGLEMRNRDRIKWSGLWVYDREPLRKVDISDQSLHWDCQRKQNCDGSTEFKYGNMHKISFDHWSDFGFIFRCDNGMLQEVIDYRKGTLPVTPDNVTLDDLQW